MNKILLGMILFLWSITLFARVEYDVKRVDDGDTITIEIPQHPAPLREVGVRIIGIDTPEKPAKSYATTGKLGKAQCAKEAELSLKATKALKGLLRTNNNRAFIDIKNFDKFGGRVDADVFVGNVNVAEFMLQNNYAIPYHGEQKTHNWCE